MGMVAWAKLLVKILKNLPTICQHEGPLLYRLAGYLGHKAKLALVELGQVDAILTADILYLSERHSKVDL